MNDSWENVCVWALQGISINTRKLTKESSCGKPMDKIRVQKIYNELLEIYFDPLFKNVTNKFSVFLFEKVSKRIMNISHGLKNKQW